MQKNLHTDHRERMRQRYLQQGADAFSTHELLEMLLYYSIPRQDTNGTAHALLEEHGGLSGVVFAETDELCSTEGVGVKSAMLIGIVGALMRRCALENRSHTTVLDKLYKVRAYVEPYFIGVGVERVYVMMFDNGMRLIDFYLACEGTVNEAYPIARAIAERALRKHASSVVIAHNHPGGLAIPSGDDLATTRTMQDAFSAVGIPLLEHIVVAGNSYTPILYSIHKNLAADNSPMRFSAAYMLKRREEL